MIIIYYQYYIMHHCVFEMQEWDVSPASLLRAAELGDADELRRQLGKAWRQETHHGDPWKFDMVLYDFILWFDPFLCGLLFMDFYCGFGLCFLVTQHDLAWPEPALFFSWKRNHGGLPQLAPMEKFGTAAMNFRETTLYSMHSLLMVVMFLEVLVEHQQPKGSYAIHWCPTILHHHTAWCDYKANHFNSVKQYFSLDIAGSGCGLVGCWWSARPSLGSASGADSSSASFVGGRRQRWRPLHGSGWHNWFCVSFENKQCLTNSGNILLTISTYWYMISYICWYLRAVSHACLVFSWAPSRGSWISETSKIPQDDHQVEIWRVEVLCTGQQPLDIWRHQRHVGLALDMGWALGMCRKNICPGNLENSGKKEYVQQKNGWFHAMNSWFAWNRFVRPWQFSSADVICRSHFEFVRIISRVGEETRKLHPSVYCPEIPLQVLLEKIPVEEWQPTVQKHASSEATKRQPE